MKNLTTPNPHLSKQAIYEIEVYLAANLGLARQEGRDNAAAVIEGYTATLDALVTHYRETTAN